MEVWKPINGYEGIYEISSLGRIKSLERRVNQKNGNSYLIKEKICKPSQNKQGYLSMPLSKKGTVKNYFIHTLVASAFLGYKHLGKKSLIVVDHKNDIKNDNRLDNLQVVTQRQNTSKRKRGTSKYTGVCWAKDTQKWQASIHLKGEKIYLGQYETQKQAYKAYLDKVDKIDLQKIKKYVY